MIGWLGYLADLAILSTYFMTTKDVGWVKWFNWANAIGAIPLVIIGVLAGAIQPVILTLAFGIIGWRGCVRQMKRSIINT